MGIKLVATGKEYICPDKPYLLMGNHQSLFDIFVIPAAIPLCFVGVEASYHFSLPVCFVSAALVYVCAHKTYHAKIFNEHVVKKICLII